MDYYETFFSFLKINIYSKIATSMSGNIYQIDVKNSLLNGNLYELIYMEQPPSFED